MLLSAGARILEYDRTMLHSKDLLVDDGVGQRRLGELRHPLAHLDLEISVAIADPGVVVELARHFLDDATVSMEINTESWSIRSVRKRAMECATELVRQSL